MKRTLIWIAVISMAIISGCDIFEHGEGQEDDRIALLNDEHLNISFGPATDSLDSRLISNTNWKATSDSKWCIVEPSSGHSGNSKVMFIVSENNEEEPRTANISFTAGSVSLNVQVVQTGISVMTLLITHEADILQSPVFDGLISGHVSWGDGEKSDMKSAESHEYKDKGTKTATFEFIGDPESLQVEIKGITGIQCIDFSGMRKQ